MTPRDRRALQVGSAAVVAALLVLRVLPWGVRHALDWRARTLQQQVTLGRAEALLAQTPAVRDSLGQALTRVVALAPALLDGRTPADAAASLASLVTLAASRHALQVMRVDPLPDSVAGVFARVAIHVELEGDVRGLAGLLGKLETGEPLLTIPQVSVDAPAPASRGAPEALHIALTIQGYALPRRGT